MIKKRFAVLLLGFMMVLSACGGEETAEPAAAEDKEKITIVTTIAQIADPIREIGGQHVEVTSLMGPGVDPHLYQATQGDINKLQKADVIFYNGLHLEGNMEEILSNMDAEKVVFALGEALSEDDLLVDEEGAIDPHIWFDIGLWQQALDEAVGELVEYKPDAKDELEKNKEKYFAEMDELKADALDKMSVIPEEQRVLVTAHDAFGYFGRMNGIEVIGLQGLSTEDEIGLTDIQSTIDLLIEKKVPAVFVESSISQKSIQSVIDGASASGHKVSLGGELFSDAMGEEGTEEGTYLGMYRHNIHTIFEALTKGVE